MAASLEYMSTEIREFTQAYIQSETPVERDLYVKPPNEMNWPLNKVVKIIQQLYGVPEFVLHSCLTDVSRHANSMHIQQRKRDPCLLYKRKGNTLEAMILI